MQIDHPYEPSKANGTNASLPNAQIGAKPQIRWPYRFLAGACAVLMLLSFLPGHIWLIASDGLEAYVAEKDLVDWLMIPTLLYAVFVMYNIAYKGTVPGQRNTNDRINVI